MQPDATQSQVQQTKTNSDQVISSELSSEVWFYHPQTGGAINFSRRRLHGTLSINNDQLVITSDAGGKVIDSPVDALTNVKSMAIKSGKSLMSAPVMTFYFNDNSKFQIDFQDPAQLQKDSLFLLLLGIFFLTRFYKHREVGLTSIRPIEDYFTQRGLLTSSLLT